MPLPLASGTSVTSPEGRSRLAMQGDGNLVVYRDGVALWNSRTFVPGSTLARDQAGNLEILDPDGGWLWTTDVTDPYGLVLTDAGALEVRGWSGTWSSTNPVGDFYNVEELQSLGPGQWSPTLQGGRLVMQTDGNLVVYRAGNSVAWTSRTAGNPGARLVLQADCNLVLYSSANRPLWFTRR